MNDIIVNNAVARIKQFVSDLTKTLDLLNQDHPPDDSIEVVPGWLEIVGFTVTSTHAEIPIDTKKGRPLFLRVRFFSMEVSICHSDMTVRQSDDLALTKTAMRTRGDVRRLCSALGIELKESR